MNIYKKFFVYDRKIHFFQFVYFVIQNKNFVVNFDNRRKICYGIGNKGIRWVFLYI
jgi:hypothetical protein